MAVTTVILVGARVRPGLPTSLVAVIAATLANSALTLGAAMVVQPEKTSDNLATYMGAFWALTGVVTIRSALAGQRTRGVPLVSGCAGVVAGLVLFLHERLDNVVAQSVLVWLLATGVRLVRS